MEITSLIISIFALGVSLVTFVFNWVVRAERAAESISARIQFGDEKINQHGIGETECFITVHNGGALPISSVAASVYFASRTTRYVATCDVLQAGATRSARITSVEACDTVAVGIEDQVELEFSDGKGRRWKRGCDGRIGRVGSRELRHRETIERCYEQTHGNLRLNGAHYRSERNADGELVMVGRDLDGVDAEFSYLAEM